MTERVEFADNMTAQISELDECAIRDALTDAETLGVGIGGTTSIARIFGHAVFVKQIPLTTSEAAGSLSTASPRALPFCSHYGVGSPSCSAGRELGVHLRTDEWVRRGSAKFFPLLYGWAILDSPAEIDLSEFESESAQARWGPAWPTIRERIEDLRSANKSIAILQEYVPDTLGDWLRTNLKSGAGSQAFISAIRQIAMATQRMNEFGLHHFDVHPENILVRDAQLLFTDFGLSVLDDFSLADEESEHLSRHRGFDRNSGLMSLFHWLLFELGYVARSDRSAILEVLATRPQSSELDLLRSAVGDAASLMAANARAALMMTRWFELAVDDPNCAVHRYENWS